MHQRSWRRLPIVLLLDLALIAAVVTAGVVADCVGVLAAGLV